VDWQDIYQSRICGADEAVRLIKSGDRVVMAHAVGEPPALVEAMVNNAEAYRGVEICHMISVGSGAYSDVKYKDNFTFNAMFTSANTRKSIAEGHGQFTPVFFHEIPGYFRKGILPIDVFLLQVTPPDKHGYCCVGVSSDYTIQGAKSATIVLAQINDRLPVVYGDTFLHVSEIDRFVVRSEPPAEAPPAAVNDAARKISEFCVDLIEDESTLQIGIGAIPEAITAGLIRKRDLGIHSELVTDTLVDLYEAGVVTNRKKSLDNGKMVSTFLMGTKKLYDFAERNPAVLLRTVDYVNNPMIVAQCNRMVSINSGIEVDFMGQVVSDSIGVRQFSGVGGQVDFIRGTSMSLDGLGKSIIALPSAATLRDGAFVSKITPYIAHGAAVTTSRNDVDIIVTEYGVARLKGKTLRQRARSLIAIAHPDFRDGLAAEFEERFGVSYRPGAG
jgi:4-hydroxybutyrate CoA-transferase